MSSLTPYRRHQTNDFDSEQIQDNVAEAVEQLLERPSLAINLLEGLTLTSGSENLIEHGLDRAVRGWRIVDVNLATDIFRNTATTADPTRFLSLTTTLTASVSIEVF